MPGRELSARMSSKQHCLKQSESSSSCASWEVRRKQEFRHTWLQERRFSISAIYDKFHEAGCTSKSTRGALWAGDAFPICGACGCRVRYRFAATFESAQ